MILSLLYFFQSCGAMNTKSKYLSSAFLMLITSVIVKIIGAVYKIPLTSFIGAVGRGYFAAAYNLCMPIHAVTMGAFPVALSHLVSKYNATGNSHMLYSLKKGSGKLFFMVGLIGMSIMLCLAVPYSKFIVGAPKSIYTIIVLAPSILFSSMIASYRGYYEGLMNMVPTSVAQSIDAVFKMIFGLIFARVSMNYLYSQYLGSGTVLGVAVKNDQQALSLIYPFTSASAMLGVVLGSVVSLLYVWLYYIINHDKSLCYKNLAAKEANKELLSFAFPIMISSAVQSVFQFLDTASIQYSLGKIDPLNLKTAYSVSVGIAGVRGEDLTTYVYGLFNSALDFKNLVPGITMALGICAVPAISREFEMKNTEHLEKLTNDILKYTMLLSCFAGLGLALCSNEILALFYGSSSPDIVLGCKNLVKYFGLTVFVYSLAGTVVFSVQAIGKPEKSIAPYILSGIVRVVLNILLIRNSELMLDGAVWAGFAGYFVMCIWNILILKRESKIKISVYNTLLKPVVISVFTYFFSIFLYSQLSDFNFILVNLLIKVIIFAVVFCILCFSLKLLNFREIFYQLKRQKNGSNT